MLLWAMFDGSVRKRRLQECFCKPKDLAAEQRPEKPARPVTGMVYYQFASILRVVNDCHREHNVTVAQVTHNRHVIGWVFFFFLNWKCKWEILWRAAVIE